MIFFAKQISKIYYFYKFEKIRFLFYGILNTIITNIILQFLLFFSSVSLATFIAQVTNLLIGFYLYSNRVFKIKFFSKSKFIFYCVLAFLTWQINFLLIILVNNKINLSTNFSAILVIPILAIWSYFIQKFLIFKNNLK